MYWQRKWRKPSQRCVGLEERTWVAKSFYIESSIVKKWQENAAATRESLSLAKIVQTEDRACQPLVNATNNAEQAHPARARLEFALRLSTQCWAWHMHRLGITQVRLWYSGGARWQSLTPALLLQYSTTSLE